jgi:hypothetical protein
MLKDFFKKDQLPSVSFATSVFEKDWKEVLIDPHYLPIHQIQNHRYPFSEEILIINNVDDLASVKAAANKWVDKGVLSRVIVASEIENELLSFFQLKKSDFKVGGDAHKYENVNSDWIYYNALGPLAAIYSCKSDYLLYLTGDVRILKPLDWIAPSLKKMEKNIQYVVANPVWNERYGEAKKESYRKDGSFYVSKKGFSDQIFLIKKNVFKRPIYNEIRGDASHFPRGDVFEKRVFSYLKNRGLERITYRHGSYLHENF